MFRVHFGMSAIEAARSDLGQAVLVVDVALVFGELLEHRELVGLVEASEADAHRADPQRHDDDGRVSPECGGDCGDAVGGAGPVLVDHDPVLAGHTCVAESRVPVVTNVGV